MMVNINLVKEVVLQTATMMVIWWVFVLFVGLFLDSLNLTASTFNILFVLFSFAAIYPIFWVVTKHLWRQKT